MQCRENLSAALAEREECKASIEAKRVSIVKLQNAADPRAIEARIEALDAAESESFAEWARAGDDSAPPVPDAKAREALTRALAEARASAEAALRASEPLNRDLAAEGVRASEIEREIEGAIAVVMLDEIEPMLADFRETAVKLAHLRQMIGEGRETALRLAERLRDTGHLEISMPVFRRLEWIDSHVRDTLTSSPPVAGTRTAWARFSADLANDADAKLAA